MRGPKRLLARHGAQADEERNGRTPVRKLVATFCAVAMSVGMAGVSMSAYADDQQPAEDATTTVEATPEVQPSEDATVGAQPEVEATDAHPEAITTDAPAVAAVGDAAPTADGDAPDFSKKVTYNNDGTYTLSMNVSGKGGETTSTTATPLDIALVLDVSGSMAWPSKKINSADIDKSETYKVDIFNNNYVTVSYRNGNWRTEGGRVVYPDFTQFYSNDTRLAVLQSSIVNFLTKVNNKNGEISEAGKKIQVSLITYANSGTINKKLTSDVDAVKTALNNLTASGATNAADGLNQAHTALTGARSDSQRVVIFYSDGQPTTSNSFSPAVASDAIDYAHTLKTDDKATVYSISADPDATTTGTTNTDLFMSYVSSNYPNAQGVSRPSANNWATPGERGPGDYYTAVSGDDSLDNIFDGIFSDITQGSVFTNVSMTDTLSQYVEFVNADAVANYGAELVVRNSNGEEVTDLAEVGLPTETGETYRITSSDGKTVSIEFPAGYALRDGFTYSLEYQIKPSDSAYNEYATNGYPEGEEGIGADGTGDSSAGQPGFRSNNEALISYTPRVDGVVQSGVTGAFPHPVVQVHYTPTDTEQTPISVEKTVDGTWRDGDSFQFTIAAQDNAPLPANDSITIGKPADGSSATAQFGEIEYTAPGVYNYTVTETPNEQNKHYVYSKAEYEVQVKVVQTGSGTPRALKIESVTCTQKKTDGGVNSNTPGIAMPLKFTNTAATATLAAGTVEVQKTVNGAGAKWDRFDFQMTPVSAPESVALGEPLITTVNNTDSPDLQAGFDELTFDTPGRYTYRVTEVKPGNTAGFQYSQASYLVTVTVKQAPNNSLTATAAVTQEKDDNGADKTGTVTGALPFTNTWVAVSNLPLTGEGGATPMLWLAIGGGLGALALLAAGGAAIWRKRRLI